MGCVFFVVRRLAWLILSSLAHTGSVWSRVLNINKNMHTLTHTHSPRIYRIFPRTHKHRKGKKHRCTASNELLTTICFRFCAIKYSDVMFWHIVCACIVYIIFSAACMRSWGRARAHTPFQLCVFFDAKNSSFVGPGQ